MKETRTMKQFFPIAVLLLLFIHICCTPPPPKTDIQHPSPPKPEMKLRIAALNMAQSTKRLTTQDVAQIVQQLKQERVEIFLLQNVVRYPGIVSRVDIIEEVSKRLEYRVVFSEMVNSGGKQTGNAIFSLYPFLSHRTIPFDKIVPASFDAALKATIDAGVTSLTIVNAQLPANIGKQKMLECMKAVFDTSAGEARSPFLLSGNIPPMEYLTQNTTLIPVASIGHELTPRLWTPPNKTFQPKEVKTLQAPLGTMVLVEFEFYNVGKNP